MSQIIRNYFKIPCRGFCLLGILLITTACNKDPLVKACPDFPIGEPTIIVPDIYKIIDATISAYHTEYQPFHIFQESYLPPSFLQTKIYDYTKRYELPVDSILVNEYIKINMNPVWWGYHFKFQTSLFGPDESACTFSSKDFLSWNRYYKKYTNSKGILHFGIPAIDSRGNAFIHYELRCGGLCGYGYFVTLIRINSQWIPVKRINPYVS